jgi:hypothetical protein
MVRFDYNDYRDRMKKLGTETRDVVVRMYTADYRAMKFTDRSLSKIQPFFHRGMTARVLSKDDPLMSMPTFRLGAFIVYPNEDEKPDAKKQLFIVSPEEHRSKKNEPFFTADHFSFVVNPSAVVGKRLNFHKTEYIPDKLADGFGLASHSFIPLPNLFDLPDSVEGLVQSGLFGEDIPKEYADLYHSIFTRHLVSQSSMNGGGGSKRRKRGAAASRVRKASGRNERTFDDLWRELPIHSILVFGLVREDDAKIATVTVFVTDRFNYSNGPQQSASVFMMPSNLLDNDDEVQVRIAKVLSSLRWDVMKCQADGVDEI